MLARRGLTLLELVMAMALLGILSVVAFRFVIHLFRYTARAGERSRLQTEATLVLNSLTADLQQTDPRLLSRFPTSLAVPRIKDVTGLGTRVWEDKYAVYSWPEKRMMRKLAPVVGSPPAVLTAAQMSGILATPNGTERTLSTCVKAFACDLTPGPAAELVLDLKLEEQTLSVKTTLALRN